MLLLLLCCWFWLRGNFNGPSFVGCSSRDDPEDATGQAIKSEAVWLAMSDLGQVRSYHDGLSRGRCWSCGRSAVIRMVNTGARWRARMCHRVCASARQAEQRRTCCLRCLYGLRPFNVSRAATSRHADLASPARARPFEGRVGVAGPRVCYRS